MFKGEKAGYFHLNLQIVIGLRHSTLIIVIVLTFMTQLGVTEGVSIAIVPIWKLSWLQLGLASTYTEIHISESTGHAKMAWPEEKQTSADNLQSIFAHLVNHDQTWHSDPDLRSAPMFVHARAH